MAMEYKGNTLQRREAVGMDELVKQFIREMKLAAGLNRQRVTAAWNTVSGASRYTVDVYLKGKTLYCTIGSSVVRNRLYFQKDVLLAQLNNCLDSDDMFIKDDDGPCITELILK